MCAFTPSNPLDVRRCIHWLASSRAAGYIIDPRDTRLRLIDALDTLRTKRDRNPPKKHGNIPL